MEINLKKYIGKRIFLKNSQNYGYVIDVSDADENALQGIDKFGEEVFFTKADIVSIVPFSGTKHND